MVPKTDERNWLSRAARLPILAASGVLVVCAVVVFYLSVDVNRQIDALATANSDNTQWTLAQVEVEYLAFQAALAEARTDPEADLSQLRKRFDIFYSRIDTIANGQQFRGIASQPQSARYLGVITGFLDDAVPLIDGADADLRGALATLVARDDDIGPAVRRLSLSGLDLFSAQSEGQRKTVAETLSLIAVLMATMVLSLLVLVFVLWRVARISRSHAIQEATTRARLESVISTSIDAILVVDTAGRIVDINGAAECIFGYSHDEAIGALMSDLIVADHLKADHEAGMQHYLTTAERGVVGSGLIQVDARRKDGSIFPVEISISSVHSDEGEIFVSFIRDISDRIAAHNELETARDKAVAGEKAKTDLLAVMSHEMRTPLNGLLGTLDLLSETPLNDEQARCIDVMRTSGDLLLHHVNDVLDVSRLDSGQVEVRQQVFDGNALVEDILAAQREAAASRGNILRSAPGAAGLSAVTGDPNRLHQVLLNLVGNAMKFTCDGEILIEAERVGDSDQVEFRVSDTGIGIGADDLSRIFDDFVTLDPTYSRQQGGTGLGLAITRRIVAAMGGEIGAESEPGEGSLFWIRLPLPAAQAPPERARDERIDTAPRARRVAHAVLLVEDNPVNRFVARAMLEREGCNVIEAIDGAQGVDAAAERAFDLILMDISMPVMDGIQATRTIRQGSGPNRQGRIVALTAHAMPEELAAFEAAGMDDTLIKPISRAAIRRTLSFVDEVAAPTTDDAEGGVARLLDSDTLEALHSDLGDDRARAIIDDFISDTDQRLKHLDSRRDDTANAVMLVDELHRIAGSAAVFGARRLRANAIELERHYKSLLADSQSDEMWRSLSDSWSQTQSALRDHLQTRQPRSA